jgi:hypothetical protein
MNPRDLHVEVEKVTSQATAVRRASIGPPDPLGSVRWGANSTGTYYRSPGRIAIGLLGCCWDASVSVTTLVLWFYCKSVGEIRFPEKIRYRVNFFLTSDIVYLECMKYFLDH